MNPIVDRIIYEEEQESRRRKLVRRIDDAKVLWQLMQHYNWDDGFAVPLEVVKHPLCDLGLALMLFWEFGLPRMYCENPHSIIDDYDSEAEKADKVSFCETLIGGIRSGKYPPGENKYDTGFFGEGLHPGDERKQRIREIKTKRAREKYEEVFMRPVV